MYSTMDNTKKIKKIIQNFIDNKQSWENEFGGCNINTLNKCIYKKSDDFQIQYFEKNSTITFKILPAYFVLQAPYYWQYNDGVIVNDEVLFYSDNNIKNV